MIVQHFCCRQRQHHITDITQLDEQDIGLVGLGEGGTFDLHVTDSKGWLGASFQMPDQQFDVYTSFFV